MHEQTARELFPLEISPEEYAARNAHRWGSCSFDEYVFSDPQLDRWVQRLGDIFFGRYGAPSIDELRRLLLTPTEQDSIARESEDDF